MVALGLFAVVRLGDDGDTDRAARTARPSNSTQAPSSSPSVWPTASGACARDFRLPRVTTTPLDERTGMRVLAGGRQLVLADVDSGRVRRLGRLPDGVQVHRLERVGTTTYLVGRTCEGSEVRLLRADDGELHRARFGGHADDLLAGGAGVWGVDYPEDHGRVRLRDTSGDVVRLPRGTMPNGVYAEGLVGTSRVADARTRGRELPRLVLLDSDTGEVTRVIGRGNPLAVGEDVLVWAGAGCLLPRSAARHEASRQCVLHRTALTDDGDDARYSLPAGRLPVGASTLGGDQRHLAFSLTRSLQNRWYSGHHPVPPANVAVLDFDTEQLHVAPDLLTPPKSRVGMALSAAGDWLLAAANQGDHGSLFVWRVGSDELQRSPVRLPGPLFGAPPLLPAG